jgi:hypothetical protein
MIVWFHSWRYIVLCILCLLHIVLPWPGQLFPDSIWQYEQAIAGHYNDHHPVLMSYLWGIMAKIHPGSGLMFLLQISMLYAGTFFTLRTSEMFLDTKKNPLLLLLVFTIPLWPFTFLASTHVVKDCHFAFSFFAVASFLACRTIQGRSLGWCSLLITTVVLLYGTGVKYQAQFCVPILLGWVGVLSVPSSLRAKLLGRTLWVLAYGGIFYGAFGLIQHAVPRTTPSHSWQLVKFFDLAAISVATDEDWIPSFNRRPNYSLAELKARFAPNTMDPYCTGDDRILDKTFDPAEQAELLAQWRRAIAAHPWIYLKHRSTNLFYGLIGRPDFHSISDVFKERGLPIPVAQSSIGYNAIKIVLWLFLSCAPFLVLGLFYGFMGLRYFSRSVFARIMTAYCALSFTMTGLLLFMSVAGVARYHYLTFLMIYACHVFFIGLRNELKSASL